MIRLISVLFALSFSTLAFAQDELPAPVKFGDSEFTFSRVEDDEIALSYNGTELYRNFFLSFDKIVKVEGQDVALFSGGDGGNACGPASLIIYIPQNAPDPKMETVGADCGAPDAAITDQRIVYVPYLRPGGTEIVQSWTPSNGLSQYGEITFTPQPKTNWASFKPGAAQHPYDVFDNKDIYDAAESLLGPAFDEVILGLSVSGEPQLIDNKYVAASGCQPHACSVAESFFGIDLEKHAVFAANRLSNVPEQFWPADFKSWPLPLQKAYEASKNP